MAKDSKGLADSLEQEIEAWLDADASAAYNLSEFVAGARKPILEALRRGIELGRASK